MAAHGLKYPWKGLRDWGITSEYHVRLVLNATKLLAQAFFHLAASIETGILIVVRRHVLLSEYNTSPLIKLAETYWKGILSNKKAILSRASSTRTGSASRLSNLRLAL